MKNYNDLKIEDSYAASKRQDEMLRNRVIERSSGQSEENRYQQSRRDQYPDTYRSAARGYMHEYVGDDRGRQDQEFGPAGFYRDGSGLHRGKGPKNYTRTDDRIAEEVHVRLTDDRFVDATQIEVYVKDGEVVMTGTVDDRSQKRRAEDIAESVLGVKHLENRVRVKD
jgi:osmotically-inducible protein OsmY